LRADARKLCLHLHLRISRILAERFALQDELPCKAKKRLRVRLSFPDAQAFLFFEG
jgi:hypothetical protein